MPAEEDVAGMLLLFIVLLGFLLECSWIGDWECGECMIAGGGRADDDDDNDAGGGGPVAVVVVADDEADDDCRGCCCEGGKEELEEAIFSLSVDMVKSSRMVSV